MSAQLPRLTVIGTGYLGATHAVCMAVLGYEVLGVDVDRAKIDALASGEVPFYEPGLPELLRKALESGRLRFTTTSRRRPSSATSTSSASARRSSPARDGADLTLRRRGGDGAGPAPDAGRCLVVGKSTVPVGTAERLTRLARRTWRPAGRGRARLEPRVPARGLRGRGHAAPGPAGLRGRVRRGPRRPLREVFAPVLEAGTPVVVTDLRDRRAGQGRPPTPSWPPRSPTSTRWPRSARRPAPTCRTWPTALAYDDRIGGRFLKPGLGFGGGCLPKDIRAFTHRAEELGVGRRSASCARSTPSTSGAASRTVDLVRELAGGDLAGVACRVLGAAFKPNSDDIRDAPALDVARMLHEEGAARGRLRPAGDGQRPARHPELPYGDSALDGRRRTPTSWCC